MPALQARLMARRKGLYEEEHPEVRAGGDRRSKPQIADLKPAFTTSTARATGKSRDTVERAARRGKALGPDTLQRIAGTSLDKGVELDALAQMPPDEREPIVQAAVAGEVATAIPWEAVRASSPRA
ncbi:MULTISPECIES: hypothetical protein [unclassified Chelatococcus]|uniref:hypothetical protein n=1 Tax=unclassified Chelatococcus TaxID=2638111 RepID=UPI001BCE3B1D|nr:MULTISPECIES: hypothetical protein [unclassified Chelatococcus]MBS7698671.1 hypothetical protein [Chelatococcus sp. YT9]MBX3554747.1 hypothetical protein [Chelatococcus sp.]